MVIPITKWDYKLQDITLAAMQPGIHFVTFLLNLFSTRQIIMFLGKMQKQIKYCQWQSTGHGLFRLALKITISKHCD